MKFSQSLDQTVTVLTYDNVGAWTCLLPCRSRWLTGGCSEVRGELNERTHVVGIAGTGSSELSIEVAHLVVRGVIETVLHLLHLPTDTYTDAVQVW